MQNIICPACQAEIFLSDCYKELDRQLEFLKTRSADLDIKEKRIAEEAQYQLKIKQEKSIQLSENTMNSKKDPNEPKVKVSKTQKPDTIVTQILEECLDIHSKRHIQYGHSEKNFANIAEIATRLSTEGRIFTALDIAVIMVATKEARYKFQCRILEDLLDEAPADIIQENLVKKALDDSLRDWINYIAIMENIRIKTQ